MKYVKCPETLLDVVGIQLDLVLDRFIFMAGGISGCVDWQTEFKNKLIDVFPLVLINPRRDDFDISNPLMSEKQIEWEFWHIDNSDGYIFWFPEETLCPITLLELGKCLQKYKVENKFISIGCHPNYKRRFDVIKQTQLMNNKLIIHSSLDEIALDVINYINDYNLENSDLLF